MGQCDELGEKRRAVEGQGFRGRMLTPLGSLGHLRLPASHTRDNHSGFRVALRGLKVPGDVPSRLPTHLLQGSFRFLCLFLERPVASVRGEHREKGEAEMCNRICNLASIFSLKRGRTFYLRHVRGLICSPKSAPHIVS